MLRFETKRNPEELFTREVVAGLAVWDNALSEFLLALKHVLVKHRKSLGSEKVIW
ncbi:MAG: hypothetical protein QXI60_10015 [Thermofilaceae archaeon]